MKELVKGALTVCCIIFIIFSCADRSNPASSGTDESNDNDSYDSAGSDSSSDDGSTQYDIEYANNWLERHYQFAFRIDAYDESLECVTFDYQFQEGVGVGRTNAKLWISNETTNSYSQLVFMNEKNIETEQWYIVRYAQDFIYETSQITLFDSNRSMLVTLTADFILDDAHPDVRLEALQCYATPATETINSNTDVFIDDFVIW